MEGDTQKFDISHLNQPPHEQVSGPIQDSEALLLYAMVRVSLIRKIVEVGGLNGYSCANFLKALRRQGSVYTIDVNFVPTQDHNHFFIQSDVGTVDMSRLGDDPIDLIFFDCHVYDAQMKFLERAEKAGLVSPHTIIALHDTNSHPYKTVDWAHQNRRGEWIHQSVEREMVNALVEKGWHAVCFHTQPERHNDKLPYRHGLTIMKKFEKLEN